MAEYLPPELDVAQQVIGLITTKWSEVGDDLSMELRALGQRPHSIRFNPKKEEKVVAVLEAAAELNVNGCNVYITINPAGPFTSDRKT